MNRIIHGVRYSTWLIGQVIVGAFVIVFDVIRVRSQMHPAVVEYPLRAAHGFCWSMLCTGRTRKRLSRGLRTWRNASRHTSRRLRK